MGPAVWDLLHLLDMSPIALVLMLLVALAAALPSYALDRRLTKLEKQLGEAKDVMVQPTVRRWWLT